MKLLNAGCLIVALVFPFSCSAVAQEQQPEPRPQTTPAKDQDALKVTIRPRPAKGPPPLYDLVIRSADGRLMFLYEWLTRPKEGFEGGRGALFDLDFSAPPEDRETRELTLHTSNFGMILGKRYLYLDFDQISVKYGWQSATQLAAASRYRGVYLPQTAEEAFDPLYQSFGRLLFQPASVFGLREWWRQDVLQIQ